MQEENGVPVDHGPGAMLSQARHQAGLSTIEVSEKLFLPESIIINLERGNYSRIVNHTFVRGYLRSYAKLMKIDADAVIDAFNALGLEDTYVPIRVAADNEARFGLSRPHHIISEKGIRRLGYIVVIGVLVAAGLWWLNEGGESIAKQKQSLSVNSQEAASIPPQSVGKPVPSIKQVAPKPVPPAGAAKDKVLLKKPKSSAATTTVAPARGESKPVTQAPAPKQKPAMKTATRSKTSGTTQLAENFN